VAIHGNSGSDSKGDDLVGFADGDGLSNRRGRIIVGVARLSSGNGASACGNAGNRGATDSTDTQP